MKIKIGQYKIIVDISGKFGRISSNLKDDCEVPDNECIGCAAIDGLESLILGHACAGIDVTSAKYVEGIKSALEGIGNN